MRNIQTYENKTMYRKHVLIRIMNTTVLTRTMMCFRRHLDCGENSNEKATPCLRTAHPVETFLLTSPVMLYLPGAHSSDKVNTTGSQ